MDQSKFSWVRRLVSSNQKRKVPLQSLGDTVPPVDASPEIQDTASSFSEEDNVSTRPILSMSSDEEDNVSFDPVSSKSTGITSMAPSITAVLRPHTPSSVQNTNNYVLFNPGTVAPSNASILSNAYTNRLAGDEASVITIASSTRDRRRRKSIDTNVSTQAIAPDSIIGVSVGV